MTLYIFDADNIAPKRLIPGAGIGFAEGGDYLGIFTTGSSGDAGTSIYGLTAGRIPYTLTGSALTDSPNLLYDGGDLTFLSGTLNLQSVVVSGTKWGYGSTNFGKFFYTVNTGSVTSEAMPFRMLFAGQAEPGIAFLNFAHDSVGIYFDAMWTGSFVASAPTAFAIAKNANQINFQFITGSARGATFPGFNIAVAITTAGQLKLDRDNGIAAGVKFGTRGHIYQDGVNIDVLRTPSSFVIDSNLSVMGYVSGSKWGYNTNNFLYTINTGTLNAYTTPVRLLFEDSPEPGISLLNYAHDNVALVFDAMHTGTWVASHAQSWSVYKENGNLYFKMNSGSVRGGTFSSFTNIALFTPSGQFQLERTTGINGGILIGGDVQLYRDSVNVLRTPDSLIIDGVLSGTNPVFNGLNLVGNASLLKLVGQNHAYIEFFPTGVVSGRKGYLGFPGAGVSYITITNEIAGGDIELNTNGGVINVDGILDVVSFARFKDDTSITKSVGGGVGPVFQLNNTGGAADDQGEIQYYSNSSLRAKINFRVRAGGAGYINWFTGPAGAPVKSMELTENAALRLSNQTAVAIKMQNPTGIIGTTRANLFVNTDKGILLITDDANSSAIYTINGNSHTVSELSDPVGAYSVTSGTVNSSNIYWGGTNYEIQNTRGASRDYSITLIGRF